MPSDAKCLQNKPILIRGLEIYHRAYYELSTERQIGVNGYGLIPWGSIVKWSNHNGMNDYNSIEKVIKFVRALEFEERRYTERNSNNG